jgi:hypothetical protein
VGGLRDDRYSKIQDFHRAVSLHYNIGWFDIPVDHSRCVGVLQPGPDLSHNLELLHQWRPAHLDYLLKITAFEEFHDDVRNSVLIAKIMNANYIGMLEAGGHRCFATESNQHAVLRSRGQKLDSDYFVQIWVVGSINLAKSSSANFGNDFVPSYAISHFRNPTTTNDARKTSGMRSRRAKTSRASCCAAAAATRREDSGPSPEEFSGPSIKLEPKKQHSL